MGERLKKKNNGRTGLNRIILQKGWLVREVKNEKQEPFSIPNRLTTVFIP